MARRARTNKGSDKLALSDYWRAPISGGHRRTTLEFIAVARFEEKATEGSDIKVIEKEFNQLSLPCFDKCREISYPGHVDIWGQFSEKW